MADFYTELGNMATDLLTHSSQGGLGQGEVVLYRTIPGVPNEDEPWVPVEETHQEETLRAAVRGVSKELVGTEVGSAVILASDRQAICAPIDMEYTAGDTLVVDGVPVHIISVENIPEAGTVSAVRFVIRG